MAKGVEVTLYDATGAAYASGTNIAVVWFDSDQFPDLGAITGRSATATTTAGGVLSLDLDAVTGLDVGDWGFLACYLLDGTDHKDSLVFASRMQVASMTGTTPLTQLTNWVRDPEWLALPTVEGLQKFAGLMAVYPSSNYVTLLAEGAYTVNWGDGSAEANYATGVKAERDIAYADVSATSDPGILNAVAVTFTGSGNTVNRTAHGFVDRETVAFSSIITTTGITTNVRYRVFNATVDAFQVSAIGGATDAALVLTGDGSGEVYRPRYRQAVVTVVPNGGDLTKLSLAEVHTFRVGLASSHSSWLDVAISGANLTTVLVGALTPGASPGSQSSHRIRELEQFSLYAPLCKNLGGMLYGARLSSVLKLVFNTTLLTGSATVDAGTDVFTSTAHGLSLNDPIMFPTITGAAGFFRTLVYYARDVTTDTFKVSSAYDGAALDVTTGGSATWKSGTDAQDLFYSGNSLQSIPFLDTSAVISFNSAFRYCSSLVAIPRLDFSEAVDVGYCFESAYRLQTLPALDYSSALNASYCFANAGALRNPRPISMPLVTSATNLFDRAYSLEQIDLSVPAVTTLNSAFYECRSLKRAYINNTSALTSAGAIFSRCPVLTDLRFSTTESIANMSTFLEGAISIGSAMVLLPEFDMTAATSIGSLPAGIPLLRRGRLKNAGVSVSHSYNYLSAEELNEVYRGLRSGVTAQTVTVTGNPGVAGDDPTIATAKGWTVTG